MRPGDLRAPSKHSAVVEQHQLVVARTKLASGVGRIVRIVSEPEAEASDIGLTVSRRMKVLRLHGGVGRNRAKDTWDAIARLGTPTEALGVEAGLEPVASK